MIYTGYDLPRSLEICDQLRDEAGTRPGCTGGVFMENISSSYGITSKWLRTTTPIYPCQVVADRHKLYCYLMVTSRILPLVDWDFEKAPARCAARARTDWVGTVTNRSGAMRQAPVAPGDVPRILGICCVRR